jgi:transcriptional regulator with XRE-family HTH domain
MIMDKANISGSKIKELREQKGLDQADLAASLLTQYNLQLDQSDISEIERGVRGIKDFELDAIARILNVDPCFLLRGK